MDLLLSGYLFSQQSDAVAIIRRCLAPAKALHFLQGRAHPPESGRVHGTCRMPSSPITPVSLRTLNDIFFAVAERDSRVVMMYRQPIQWVSISSQEFYRSVVGVARALRQWGIKKGDRVAILSENRPEWSIADFACLLLGVVVVPIYSTLTDEQTAYLLNDSGAKAIFVSSEALLQKVLAVQSRTPVEKVVVMDTVETAHAFPMHRLMNEGPPYRDPQFDAQAQTIRPDDLATVIYTSGTTGVPKGAMLTHGNMASNINYSMADLPVGNDEISVSFLPLSHVTARHVDFTLLYHNVTLAYVPFIEYLPKALLEVRPTLFIGVPRVYEKVHTQVEARAIGIKKALYHWALSVGRKHREEILKGQSPRSFSWKLADRFLYSKIRAGMGDRVGLFISGGAPLGSDLAEWYADVGIRIHEGYGLTETSPVIAVNTPRAHKLGTVGKPLPNIEVRIAEDGELLVRGPSVFKGYWNLPDETHAAFAEGKWFKTGDIANLDDEGFLSITDRKKDLIKTSGGKFIAPQPLENSLKHNALIAEALIVGDKRKFPAVLLVPYFPLLEDWARANHVAFGSRHELVNNEKVRHLYEGIVADFNHDLARFEQLKKTVLLAEEFSPQNGTLTASYKMRRREVEKLYSRQIEEIYAHAEAVSAAQE
jgi:long-chain acyl-CoA synthetase